jgi:1,5-anhydro-D-fructose reductase (1,5-anhydro-D-mannitol-forming)
MMRIALISFWHLHGADYAAEAEAHPDVEIAAIWDEDPARGRAEADARGIPFVASLDDVLADPSIDGVVVCSPTRDHLDIVTACTRAGKHVFMEKVLADTLDSAERIVDAAREADVTLTVSLWRSDKGYARQIAGLVASGAVGQVTNVRIRDGHPFALRSPEHPDGFLPAQFYDPDTARGGVLIDLCHPLYLTLLICGLPTTAASGFGHVAGRTVEDNAAVVMTWPDGALAIAETSAATRITPFSIEVHGTGGSILYSEPGIGALVHGRRHPDAVPAEATRDDVAGLRVFSGGDDARWVELDIEADRPQAFSRWVELVRTGQRDDENNALALGLSALVEAAYASAATGRRLPVREPAPSYAAARP